MTQFVLELLRVIIISNPSFISVISVILRRVVVIDKNTRIQGSLVSYIPRQETLTLQLVGVTTSFIYLASYNFIIQSF